MDQNPSERFDKTTTDAETASSVDSETVLALQCATPDPTLAVIPLRSGMTLGRGESCSVRLTAAAASRHHATIELRSGLWWCQDAGSTNGTHVNGRAVESSPIGPGDVLRCGEWVWIVVRVPAAIPYARFQKLATDLWGGATLMQAVEPARRVATTTLPLIVEGETGSGKECVASAVHEWSQRSGRFVAVNCATLAGNLAEAGLFGYRKGAFTGAERSHDGYIRAANGGTLLLDEICELALPTQAKLLRVLEQQEVIPLGESHPIRVDVRVVAAAQESLERLVAERRFRPDLLARLRGLMVRIPPLRERKEDVAELFHRFLTEGSGGPPPRVHARLMEALLTSPLSENVRGLRQLARQLVGVHGHESVLRRSHLPPSISHTLENSPTPATGAVGCPADTAGTPKPAGRTATQEDWPELLRALQATKGNVAQAAHRVGLSRHQAYRLMKLNGFSDLAGLRGPIPQ